MPFLFRNYVIFFFPIEDKLSLWKIIIYSYLFKDSSEKYNTEF